MHGRAGGSRALWETSTSVTTPSRRKASVLESTGTTIYWKIGEKICGKELDRRHNWAWGIGHEQLSKANFARTTGHRELDMGNWA